uniref:ABI family member 3 binding protein n=1 Tax=Myripristis murdjan TaxID=586833 RepID=A0A667ZGB2_9TELE
CQRPGLLWLEQCVLSSPVRRQNMKVRINATGDTIVMKFLRPNPDTKLEGYILGYGSSMFSKQFIQLPENGQPYETEIDAEPKYLIAVQPIPTNDVKKQCTGKVELEKPLHLVIGSVTPTSVLLSWGTLLKTPYEGNIMNDCLEDGHYTVRYRERTKKWNYQTCPTSDTVIDNLKPNTAYEFGVQPNSKDGSGAWSMPVIHNTNMGGTLPEPLLLGNPETQPKPKPQPQPEPKAKTQPELQPRYQPETQPQPNTQLQPKPQPKTQLHPKSSPQPQPETYSKSQIQLPTKTKPQPIPQPQPQASVQPKTKPKSQLQPLPKINSKPLLYPHPQTSSQPQSQPEAQTLPNPQLAPQTHPPPRLQSQPQPGPQSHPQTRTHSLPTRARAGGGWPLTWARAIKTRTKRAARKCWHTQLTSSHLSRFLSGSRFDMFENSSIFSSLPASEVDAMGKKRFVAPHVIYKTDKKPDEPCSITSSLSYFPDEEGGEQNVTGPPRVPPSNLTVVTVEGCPSFVILDWEKSDNETKEYEVVSKTKGPNGEEVSILTTNQTHTAVENLKPESSYEFKVTPKNELGSGPSTDPVSFSTESADPRVSENVSGKDAIWTQFPFKADAYSECNGKQYVKRTWYRKFVGIQLCNSLRYKIYLSDSLNGKFYNIGDQTGHGEDHCQFVDSFLDGRTGTQLLADQLPSRSGFFRAMRQEPVHFGEIGGKSHVTYVGWYECGTPIPGKW